MYQSTRQHPWEKRGGRDTQFAAVTYDEIFHMLRIVEDNFIPHPTTEGTVQIEVNDFLDINTMIELIDKIKTVVSAHKLKMINYGLGKFALLINFKTKSDAALFKLFWEEPS